MKKLNPKSLVIGILIGVVLLLVSGGSAVMYLTAGSFETTTLVVDDEVYLITTNTRTSVVKVHHIVKFGEAKPHTTKPWEYEHYMFPETEASYKRALRNDRN